MYIFIFKRKYVLIGDLKILRNIIILRFIGIKGYILSLYFSVDWYEWGVVIIVCLIVYVSFV